MPNTNDNTSAHWASLGLAEHHVEMLKASAISPEVAEGRGYQTITAKPEDVGRLKDLGLPAKAGLLIPLWTVTGKPGGFQLRPDSPRVDSKGRVAKYLSRKGQRNCLDVNPLVREALRAARQAIFVTEGAKKVDALATLELPSTNVSGVFSWRGRNAQNGLTALGDWEDVSIRGSIFVLAFDNDAWAKPPVYHALARLRAFLLARGADAVRVLVLPPSLNGKAGVDDFLAATGASVEDLARLVVDDLPAPPSPEGLTKRAGPYAVMGGVICHERRTTDGPVFDPLCNFDARIAREETRDDGAERTTMFVVDGTLLGGTRLPTTEVQATAFGSMRWVPGAWGNQAVVYAGMGTVDHLRAAIQLLSKGVERRTVYGHLGWRKANGEWIFLHAGGAIGRDGAVPDVSVSMQDGKLACYQLPAPPTGDALVQAVRASLSLLDLAPRRITMPAFASIYGAPLNEADPLDFSVYFAGRTGSQKTSLTALAQAHYGAEFHDRNLPGNWSSSDNALEKQAFLAKDCVFVVDDFAPAGTTADVQRLHLRADRLLRAQGNRAGRGRMRPDGSLRPEYAPRGLIVSSGEDVPVGQSLRARMLTTEVAHGDMDLARLTQLQAQAGDGLLAQAMAGFVQWLAGRMDDLKATQHQRRIVLRDAARRHVTVHDRMPDVAASLMLGLEQFAAFAGDSGAMTAAEVKTFLDGGWHTLLEIAQGQGGYQRSEDPVSRFITLTGAAIASGAAHIADAGTGAEPIDPEQWGWRARVINKDAGVTWDSQGKLIGWLHEKDLLLEPDAAFAAVQRLAREQETSLPVTQRTLWKRLAERGMLASQEESQHQNTVRRTVAGVRRRVLHLHAETLSPTTSPISPDSPENAGEASRSRPRTDFVDSFSKDGQKSVHENSPAAASRPTDGHIGLIGLELGDKTPVGVREHQPERDRRKV